MKFNITIDKKAEAVINERLCINCGECSNICPTGAVEEYHKTVFGMFPDCSRVNGKGYIAENFDEAKKIALESNCTLGCPLGIVPQAIAALVKSGDIENAYRLIDEKNPMPWVCASICDHICQDYCQIRNIQRAPINMAALEGYILDNADIRPYKHIKRFDERIAIIGGGPAGLAAAFELSKSGYDVTIFEKDSKLGGVLSWGIPDFRLNKDKLEDEISRIISAGINVRYNHNIGKDYALDDIWREGFAACLIAIGTSESIRMPLPGADADMVYDGVTLMRQITGSENQAMPIGDNIVVIGGGELAAGMARLLKRMGKTVTCAAFHCIDDLQMSERSRLALREEGIEFRSLIGPKQIISERNKVKAVEFIGIEYIEDETGQLRRHGIKGSEFNLFCDTVVIAVGQKCNVANISNVETYPDGKVKVNRFHKTNKDMLFACGAAVGMDGSVAEAMASGRAAAIAIDKAIHRNDMSKKSHDVLNAPDISVIYPENVQQITPQFEHILREDGDANADVYGKFTEDILPILRDMGIEEEMPQFTHKDETGKFKQKIAVIGGGVAGLTAAIDLAKAGYSPTVFEKYPALGGSYKWLSSHKRIDKALLDKELSKIPSSGIDVICNVPAGIKPNIKGLFDEGYEAVLFAIGESCGKKPAIENVGCRGVFDIVSLMGKLMSNEKADGVGQQVLITGCDELTFDAARLLKEFCRQVTVMAPLSKGKLKAGVTSVAAALDEGVNLVTGVELLNINETNGILNGIKCKVIEKNITIDISCDTLVLGNTKIPDTHAIAIRNDGLDIDQNGYIQVDERLITSIYGVFAIGDFDMSSIEAGHAGASAVQSFIESRDFCANGKVSSDDEVLSGAAVKYEIFEGCVSGRRGFESGRVLFDRHQAYIEASRCLGCGYHKTVSEKCIGCGICASVCPANAITLRGIVCEQEEEQR